MSASESIAKRLNSLLAVNGETPNSADAIVVLGAPCTAVNELNELCKRRVQAAAAFWQARKAPWLITTGHRGEAITMANYARNLGVERDAIVIEPHAQSTKENASKTAELMRQRGLSTAIVVSNQYHVRRGLFWFRKMGIDCVAGTPVDDPPKLEPVAREFAAWGYTLIRSISK